METKFLLYHHKSTFLCLETGEKDPVQREGAMDGHHPFHFLSMLPGEFLHTPIYSVMQSDRNSLKTDIFHKPTT